MQITTPSPRCCLRPSNEGFVNAELDPQGLGSWSEQRTKGSKEGQDCRFCSGQHLNLEPGRGVGLVVSVDLTSPGDRLRPDGRSISA